MADFVCHDVNGFKVTAFVDGTAACGRAHATNGCQSYIFGKILSFLDIFQLIHMMSRFSYRRFGDC